jgi:hypothetical protein
MGDNSAGVFICSDLFQATGESSSPSRKSSFIRAIAAVIATGSLRCSSCRYPVPTSLAIMSLFCMGTAGSFLGSLIYLLALSTS